MKEISDGDIVCAWIGSQPYHASVRELFDGPSHSGRSTSLYIIRSLRFPVALKDWIENYGQVILMNKKNEASNG